MCYVNEKTNEKKKKLSNHHSYIVVAVVVSFLSDFINIVISFPLFVNLLVKINKIGKIQSHISCPCFYAAAMKHYFGFFPSF